MNQGHEVIIIAPSVETTPNFFEGSRVVGLSAINLNRVLPIALPNQVIERTLRNFSPDIVHLASPAIMGSFAQRSAHIIGIPTIAIYQTDYVGFSSHYRMKFATGVINQFIRNIHGTANLNLAPSQFAAENLRTAGVNNIAIWGRGVDLDLFNPKRRQEKLFANGKIALGYVGRLAPEKSIHRLRVLNGNKNIQLVIIGDGPERERLKRLLPQAIFTGKRSGTDLAEHVASLDVFIHPGDHETFCQAAQEALASGVPVIAPKKGAVREFILEGVNGLTIDMSRAESLSDITDIEWNHLLSREMRESARRSVEDRSWGQINAELIKHYQSVIAKSAPSAKKKAS